MVNRSNWTLTKNRNSMHQNLYFRLFMGWDCDGSRPSWVFQTQEHFPAPPEGPSGVLGPDGISNPRSECWAYGRASSPFDVPGNPKLYSVVFVFLTLSLCMYEESHMLFRKVLFHGRSVSWCFILLEWSLTTNIAKKGIVSVWQRGAIKPQ